MYLILLVASWMLAANFYHLAPAWLTLVVPSLLSVAFIVRLAFWLRSKRSIGNAAAIPNLLSRTNLVAVVLGVGILAWTGALFPYGDAFLQAHVTFFLALSAVSTMFCLVHARAAAATVAAVAVTGAVALMVLSGNGTIISMSLNVLLAVLAALILVSIQGRDMERMVRAQAIARQRDREQRRLLRMVDDMPVAVMTVDPDTLVINYANETSLRTLRQIQHLLPIKADELVGTCIDVFHKLPEGPRAILSDPSRLPQHTRIRLGPEVLDLRVTGVWSADGGYIGPMLAWAVVTKEVEAQQHIQWLAHHDTLTKLPNRAQFRKQLDTALGETEGPISLLFVDLDGFKLVNDTMGHVVGDEVLTQVAARLLESCAGLNATIGRIGGDEFAIILPSEEGLKVDIFCSELIAHLSQPYRLEDQRRVEIGASIGVAQAPLHGRRSKELLSRADIALSVAKVAGKASSRMFEPEMERKVHARVAMEARLREALRERTGLYVFYQPILDIASGRITAREALVRWHLADQGWISPSDFIPIAEQSGLIRELGLFVLEKACADAAQWEDGARVAVNVSPGQLGQGTIASSILSILVQTGLTPDRLEVEITETALLNEEANGVGDLRQLRAMGVRVALDDFGTGYSSLAHLRAFPFDKIKIDGSFVRDALNRPDCAAVVGAVADLGRRLGVTTVAEGVETEEHLKLVTREGCVEVQGHYFGTAEPAKRDWKEVSALAANAA
ncbi:EAL domain-containing protein [Erythrobacter sp. SG61-1L]|uniref:putative bifunctional diguanylate cyclase/phosphodiesterase n=1 Tax=Erythrobacter sp. SG61-1L TaxID=1603897 RepID=UPI0018F897AA|nr:EAL domain-containing protein [Erythrobacter sp. SG61-1L]